MYVIFWERWWEGQYARLGSVLKVSDDIFD